MTTTGWAKSSYSAANGHCVEWRKSTYSTANGACVEFRRASQCNGGTCTEVAVCPDGVLVRDSQLGDGSPVLSFGAGAWQAFTRHIKAAS